MRKGNNIWIYSYILLGTLFLLTNTCKKDDILSENGIIFNPKLSYGSIVDIDGNTYKTIVIGTQTWMAENLKTTKYSNGELIETTTPSTLNIWNEIKPKYQWAAGNDESNVATYGRSYTWYAVADSRNLCPTGWHVPTDAEWTILTSYLGNNPIAGKLKEVSTLHWRTPNAGATNESGFTALPGGGRQGERFEFDGGYGSWWSASESWHYTLYFGDTYADRSGTSSYVGFSVRCVKD